MFNLYDDTFLGNYGLGIVCVIMIHYKLIVLIMCSLLDAHALCEQCYKLFSLLLNENLFLSKGKFILDNYQLRLDICIYQSQHMFQLGSKKRHCNRGYEIHEFLTRFYIYLLLWNLAINFLKSLHLDFKVCNSRQ